MKFLIVIYIIGFLFVCNKTSACSFNKGEDTLKIVDTNKTVITIDSYFRLKKDDAFPTIVLYDTAQNIVRLDSIFKGKKGVMFITGSYSCPHLRREVNTINKMIETHLQTHDVYFVYIKEAHPVCQSPYGESNDHSGADHPEIMKVGQQQSIEERIMFAKMVVNDLGVQAKILIDNERNEFFWKAFSGPNGIMIFSSEGKLIHQREWYNQSGRKPGNR